MSNTSDQTTQQSKTRLIIGEIGVDTETGIIGKGHSYDNGKTFTVDDTIYGRIYHAGDHDKIWKGIQDQVAKVVDPAKSAADSAVSAADAAVASAQVTSDAVSAIASATAEAKQGANEAMSRALSAWDIATGAKSAVTDFDPLLKSAQSDASKALTQIADTASALSDAKTAFGSDVATAKELASTAQTTADSAVAVASDARSNATVAVQTASGASLTAIDAKDDATIAKQTASEATVQASNAESNFAQLSIRANKIEANVANNSGAIASVQQTANGLTTTVANIKANGGGVNLAIGTDQEYTMGYGIPNTVWQDGYAYLKLPITLTAKGIEVLPQDPHSFYYNLTPGQDYTQTVWLETDATVKDLSLALITWFAGGAGHDIQSATLINLGENRYKLYSTYKWPGKSDNNVRLFDTFALDNAFDLSTGTYLKFGKLELEEGTVSHTWSPAPDDLQNQFTQIKQSVNGVITTINDPKTGLNATYQTAAGNSSTISSVKGDVTQLQSTANGLTSRVGNLESKTDKQQTTIDQNKAAIVLKADQTTVNTLKGNVDQNTSTLKTQADQIQAKVSASDVTGMLNGYATQNYAQSLVTQTADKWNLNLTNLQTDVNAIKTTSVGTNLFSQSTATSGYIDGGTGIVEPTSSSNEIVSDYIPVNASSEYTFQMWGTTPSGNTSWYGIGLYDSNKNFISRPAAYGAKQTSDTTEHVSTTLTTTSTTAYVRVSFSKYNNYKVKFEKGSVATDWSPAPSDLATVTSVANLSATVNGIQSQVYNSDGSSKITQLSSLIQDKVSSGDFTSTTTQLKNLINQRVQVGDVISQINQEAGGNTLIQVSNGKGSLILDAGNTIITGKAWIPSAAIANLTADQVQAGTLSGSTVHAGDNSGNAIDMGVLSTNYVGLHAYANNGNHTYIDLNGIHNYGASYDTRIQQGKITTDYLTVNGGGMIDFRADGAGILMDEQEIKFYNSGNVNGGISFAGSIPIAQMKTGGSNELRVRYDGSFALTPISDESTRIVASTIAMGFGYQQDGRSVSDDENLTGLWVNNSDRYVRVGSWKADSTWSRAEFGSDGVNINSAGLSLGLKDNVIHMYMDGNYSATAMQLTVDGWAWINGYCEAMGHTQHSTLSTKTRIEEANPDHMLDLVNNTELTTFAFKSEVAEGVEVRHIGPIIDDINDVAQYRTPAEFIAPTKTARDDDNMIGALFGAVQALTKRIKKLEDKLNG